jgi:hypothetical protein
VRIGLGAVAAAAAAVPPTALAMQTATVARAASLIAVLLDADAIVSSVGDGRRRREGVT